MERSYIEGEKKMSKKAKINAKVLSQKMIAPDIYDMWFSTELSKDAHAGQFIGV